VRVDVEMGDGEPYGDIVFRAAPGERNRVTVSTLKDPDRKLIAFRDRGALVVARGDCRQIDAHAAFCPYTVDGPKVRLGDRGDRADVRTGEVEVFGGKGADRLNGHRGRDWLYGGAGDDRVLGGHGWDSVVGGPGRDRVEGGGGTDDLGDGEEESEAAHDVLDGGPGRDSVRYGTRRRGVRIDLASPRNEDRFVSIERVYGGSGNDVLTGDAGANLLDGQGGADRINGAGGDDFVDGSDGNDTLYGDEGDDELEGWKGDDQLDGGAGNDKLADF
jgi:Ca2+-binding RTX toxin-like protein